MVNIPAISSKIPVVIQKPLLALRNAIQNAVTNQDLIAIGLVKSEASGLVPIAQSASYAVPTAIIGLTATGAFASIIVEWSDPSAQSGFAYTNVYRSSVDDVGQAVKVGSSAASLFSDTPPNSSTAVTYYYWVRGVNKGGIEGPYNQTAGTAGVTASDPAYAMEILLGQIQANQLNTTLNSRINLIDAPTTGLIDKVAQEIIDRGTAITAEATARTSAIGTAVTAEATRIDGVVATLPTAAGVTAEVTAAVASEATARTAAIDGAVTAEATRIDGVVATLPTAAGVTAEVTAAVASEATARTAAIDGAVTAEATRIDTVVATLPTTLGVTAEIGAAVSSESTARTTAIAAEAARIDTVVAALPTDATVTAAIQVETTARATAVGAIEAQYSVRTDVNGKIAGFGLINGGGLPSVFEVVVDRFAVVHTDGLGSVIPFVVSGGVTYMSAAMIQDATITNAKIGALAVDSAKIADAAIMTAKIGDAQVTSAKVGTAQIGTAHIQTAAIATAHIQDAQITTAKIGDAQITTAKIGAAAVDTLHLAGQAMSIPIGAYTGALYTIPQNNNGYFTVQTLTFTSLGYPNLIIASAGVHPLAASGRVVPTSANFLVQRNGVTVLSGSLSLSAAYAWDSWAITGIFAPAVGAVTYTLLVAFNGSAGGYVASRALSVIELKR